MHSILVSSSKCFPKNYLYLDRTINSHVTKSRMIGIDCKEIFSHFQSICIKSTMVETIDSRFTH